MQAHLYPGPSISHIHVCTYIECNAQGESTARAYRFGLLEGSPRKMVVFFRRLENNRDNMVLWHQKAIDDAIAEQIQSALKAIHIPLHSPARNWCSFHFLRSLSVGTLGMSLELRWDAEDSPLGDALQPLLKLLRQEVEETGLTSGKPLLSEVRDNEL